MNRNGRFAGERIPLANRMLPTAQNMSSMNLRDSRNVKGGLSFRKDPAEAKASTSKRQARALDTLRAKRKLGSVDSNSDEETHPPSSSETSNFNTDRDQLDDLGASLSDDGFEAQESLADDSENLKNSVVRVLEIIPDVDPEHVTKLVAEAISQDEEDVVENVLHILLEDPGYPKVTLKQGTGKRKRENSEDQEAGSSKCAKFEYDDKPRRGTHYSDLALVRLSARRIPPTHRYWCML